MDISDEELIKIVHAFNRSKVVFMLVGGFAVSYYGYSRTTADFDLWIMPSNENRKQLLSAMEFLGYSKEEILELSEQDFTQPVSFQIGGHHFYVDVMTFLTGVSFEEAYPIAVDETIGQSEPLKIIHRNHLIVNKLLTGRTKDKLDVESLLEIEKKKK
jgi:hypothetical protein